MTRIAVYGLKDERDLAAFLAAGADGAVFQCGVSGSDVILPSTAKRLSGVLPPCIPAILYAQHPDAEGVAGAVEASELRTVLVGGLSIDDTAKLRQRFPFHKFLRLFSGRELPEYSGREYAPFLAGFVLSCPAPEEYRSEGIRDWMMRSPLPVFFMGKGEILQNAAADFHPFGVLLPCPRLPGGVPDDEALRNAVRRLKEA